MKYTFILPVFGILCIQTNIGNANNADNEELILDEILKLRTDVVALREIVTRQDSRIELQDLLLADLKNNRTAAQNHIGLLKNKLISLERTCTTKRYDTVIGNWTGVSKSNIERHARLLAQFRSHPSVSNEIVAFYAYMTNPEINPGAHHLLVFDNIKTNVGDAYSHNTGVFTAPVDGVYVFIWKMRLHQAEHSSELIVNADVYGATFLRSSGTDDGSVTGTVVAQLSQGDEVFVRIHSTYAGSGNVHNNVHGHSSFAGWKLN